MNGLPPPQALWREASNNEGRVYYYNTVTKATQWTKPVDLMSPQEVSISIVRVGDADFRSAPSQISPGRNIQRKKAGNIGPTRLPSKALGKYRQNTKKRWLKVRRLQSQACREYDQ